MSDPSQVRLGAHIHTWRVWKREQRRLRWEAAIKDGTFWKGMAAAFPPGHPLLGERYKQPYLLERFLRRA